MEINHTDLMAFKMGVLSPHKWVVLDVDKDMDILFFSEKWPGYEGGLKMWLMFVHHAPQKYANYQYLSEMFLLEFTKDGEYFHFETNKKFSSPNGSGDSLEVPLSSKDSEWHKPRPGSHVNLLISMVLKK